ncbi:uncharacterized protein LOC128921910 isoform X2 [Zeugodacus cucurbitae]|uniref:uncharacterized protein LOC128921910 isoform X2 n=1 Tax=Zeugodacus cucurbitae TaxID=28588 RepID=UPI0023D8E29E|nr:uncharacterized protein LOC128921910 isoform X2 [Zeugodacus cucurbitae]
MYSKRRQRRLINAEINEILNNLLIKQVLNKVEKKTRFPVCDVMQLAEIEDDVSKNKATKSVYQVSIIKNIIGSLGVTNGMKKILSDSVMVQLNYDGLQDKVAFKKFECLNNAIYAMQVEGFTKENYERELKRAFKMGKNRYHKAGSLKKQKDKQI